MAKTKRRYEVWFRDDPFYMVLSERYVLRLIATGSHRLNPILRYRRLTGEPSQTPSS